MRNKKVLASLQKKFYQRDYQCPTYHWQHKFVIPGKPSKSSPFAVSSIKRKHGMV